MMKGLWIKDLYVIKKQAVAMVITFVLSVFCLMFFNKLGIFVGMGIFAVTNSFIMLNSLTSDQQNNGMSYLLTLPFSKKQYVIEKYSLLIFTVAVSVVLVSGVSWLFSINLNWGLNFLEILARTYLVGLAVLVVLIITTQVQLKEGPEKAQLAMSIVGASVAVIVGGLFYLVKSTDFGIKWFGEILEYYYKYGFSPFIVLFTSVSALFIGFSLKKSIKSLEFID